MKMIGTQQVRKIYAIGNALGIVEQGNEADNLHILIETLTEKTSVKELTYSEAVEIIKELQKRQGTPPPAKRKRKPQNATGGVTEGQKNKVWALMYQLEKYDSFPMTATLGERLCGIIKKELHIDTAPQNPFTWIDTMACNKLIEVLKKYVANAQKKAGEAHGTGGHD